MDSLDIEGKEYISARRAGSEHGYTSDYIGQLVRKGSLEGKKVGRAWYVSVDSLSAYEKVLEKEKETRSAQMKEEVAKYAEAPVKAIVHPPIVEPYREVSAQPEIKEEPVSKVSVHDVDSVFGMRYLSDEESVLPALETRRNRAEDEIRVPIRTMERDFATHSLKNDAVKEEEYIPPARIYRQRNSGSRFGGVLKTVAGFATAILLIGATVGAIFMEKTITLTGENAVASVSMSWAK